MTSPRFRRLATAVIVSLILTPGAATAKRDVAVLLEISNLEDRRTLGDGRLAELLKDDEPETRAAAARAFGRIGSEEGTLALVGAIEDSDPEVRREIVFALGLIGSAEARDALRRVAASNNAVRN